MTKKHRLPYLSHVKNKQVYTHKNQQTSGRSVKSVASFSRVT